MEGSAPSISLHPPIPFPLALLLLPRSIAGAGRGDGADRLRFVDAQHEALGEVKLVVDAVLADIPRAQILAEDEDADARVDQNAAFDRRLVDAARAEPA